MSGSPHDEEEIAVRAEVERRLGRPFERVQAQLEDLFGKDWEEIEIAISTSADKKQRSEADVICDLVAKAEERPPIFEQARRAVIRWIGKPWRERENPWGKYKDRIADLRRTPTSEGDNEEWRPWGPEDS